MKLVSIVGARPQFVKLAPFARAIQKYNDKHVSGQIEHVIIHSGQHYDPGMSEVFFDELEIPKPDYNLEVGSGTQGWQTGRMLEKLDTLLQELKPDRVIVYGDTNSTLAGALAAIKLHQKLIHVEAGLRSFNRNMPEEINRIVADHVCGVLLAPTQTAMNNLEKENLAHRSIFTGDIMYDTVLFNHKLAETRSYVVDRMGLTTYDYGVVTIHRADNTEITRLPGLLKTLNEIAEQFCSLIFPVHPRTRNTIERALPDWNASSKLHIVEPQGYLDMLSLVANSRVVLTDSGGLQKEAFFLNVPCITLRSETEWTETVSGQGNAITNIDAHKIKQAMKDWQQKYEHARPDFTLAAQQAFGDGHAADKILTAVLQA